MVLLILQWNARSLIANGQEFKKVIEDKEYKPHIICIQETWLKPHLDFVIQGYTSIRRDRQTGNGGGVAIFIKNEVTYRVIELGDEHELITVEVFLKEQSIKVINYYNPCNRLSMEVLEKVMGRGNQKVIWCGDFNAYNTLWGSNNTDHNGKIIEEMIDLKSMVCMNDGRATRIDVARGRCSSIDLTLVSEGLAGICMWDTWEDSTIGSDHYVISCKIGIDVNEITEDRIGRWKFKMANWEAFKYISEVKLQEFILNYETEDVEMYNEKLCEVLYNTAEEIIGKSKEMKRKKSVPWWTELCSKAIQDRNKAFKRVRRMHIFDNFIAYKKEQAKVRRVIRAAKKSYWRNYCDSIGEKVDVSEVWGMIRKMGGFRRNPGIPTLSSGEEIAVTNGEKAEMLAGVFVKVHSNDNITEEMKINREESKKEHPNIMMEKRPSNDHLDMDFTLQELKRAVGEAKQTSPGKDEICYTMIKNLSDFSLNCVLRLFNQVWSIGRLPSVWKHGIIIPVLKPAKNKHDATSYRPIALTSNLCKIMERMIVSRMNYILERKGIISRHQSGFRKGRSTIDAALCLETDIRKAQVNKEVVVGIFFDIEKAYDMIWKEGLLIKLEQIGIVGRMFNWIKDFLLNRTVQVRVGSSYSRIYKIDNGTPQGSVCSPLLFNIMINDVFQNVKIDIGRSLYADDGAIWKRGRNVSHVTKIIQTAVNEVEKWANKWSFRLSVAKTQLVCFAKRNSIPEIKVKLYGQVLEQVKVIKYLGIWMDSRLTFKTHIEKVIEKCKRSNNILRCLTGMEWGACRKSLQRIYCALIRSVIDYGYIIYGSASESWIKKVETVQAQSIRICCGAFRSSPLSALQVEVGELPIGLRKLKLAMNYWVNIKGHTETHPVKEILKECWEYGNDDIRSFGWTANKDAMNLGITDIPVSPSVVMPNIPPWLLSMPQVDFHLQYKFKNEKTIHKEVVVQQYLDQAYSSMLHIFTDGSKDPASGHTAAAVYIQRYQVKIQKRITNYASVFTTELIAILLAIQWVEEVKPTRAVICSDSISSLNSLSGGTSTVRQELIYEILINLLRIQNMGLILKFVWVPAHVGVQGNETVDKLAKQALKHMIVEVQIPLSKAEIKGIIKNQINKKWQEMWDRGIKGRHLYSIQKQVGKGRLCLNNRKEDIIITRLRIGHSGLNQTLYIIGKHQTGLCIRCSEVETIEHVLLHCTAYNRERGELTKKLKELSITNFNLTNLLSCASEQSRVQKELLYYLKVTGLEGRI